MNQQSRRQFLQTVGAASVLPVSLVSPRHMQARSSRAPRRILCGQIGTRHAHASGKMATMVKFKDDFQVVGVVEPDAKRRQAMKSSAPYRNIPWMTEEQLLNTPGLQMVAVETEVRQLIPTAQRCIDAGIHIHLDKPAGESLPAFRRLLETATSKKRVVQMGYMFRYNPAFQFLFEAVRKGWLGEIFETHAVISKTVGDSTRQQLAAYPGGSMFELGCHLIDAVVATLGKPDKVTPFIRRTRPQQDSLADNQLAVFEYPKATATVRSALMEVDGGQRRQMVVCGDQGTISIRPLEPPQLSLTLAKPRETFSAGTHPVPLPRPGGRYDGDFKDLAQIIRGEKSPDYSAQHDLAVQEAVLLASGLPTQ